MAYIKQTKSNYEEEMTFASKSTEERPRNIWCAQSNDTQQTQQGKLGRFRIAESGLARPSESRGRSVWANKQNEPSERECWATAWGRRAMQLLALTCA
ncbi:hypothetical protein Tcan_08193 [Toxocara canis]|uniref:Uncharacterized protein n=1 Tax=Toxocara canis TaxID=6265 RepID=A0A0B2VRR9_TOXCA|nr:hypothetical protein Tcan_08193 [Toxocara canis]